MENWGSMRFDRDPVAGVEFGNQSATMMSTMEADEDWWPPTFTPVVFAGPGWLRRRSPWPTTAHDGDLTQHRVVGRRGGREDC